MTLGLIFDALITVLRWVMMLQNHSPEAMESSPFSIDEPLTHGMKSTIRSGLKKYYHSYRKSVYGRDTKWHWTSDIDELFGMSTLGNPMTPLEC